MTWREHSRPRQARSRLTPIVVPVPLNAEHCLSGHARDEFDPCDLAPGRDQRRNSRAGAEKAASQNEITGRRTFPQEEAEDDNSHAAEDGYNR